MKKVPKKDGEKPRRLTLHRETLQLLDPAALELAEGGGTETYSSTTTENTFC